MIIRSNKVLSLFLVIGIAVSAPVFASAQRADEVSAAIDWKRYKVDKLEVSVLFPKLPIVQKSTDPCTRVELRHYLAYADEAVYQLTIVSKRREKPPFYCRKVPTFGPATFSDRLTGLRRGMSESSDQLIGPEGNRKYIFEDKYVRQWIIDDVKNGKWVELSVAKRPDHNIDADRFFDSLSLSSDPAGIDIGAGAERTLGDSSSSNDVVSEAANKEGSDNSDDETFIIRFKPKASYTDAARRKGVTGTVRLKVTLLSNGGIGNITKVSKLSHGLTEEAIRAAQRIVFIPKKVKGKNISVVVTVEYGFQIY